MINEIRKPTSSEPVDLLVGEKVTGKPRPNQKYFGMIHSVPLLKKAMSEAQEYKEQELYGILDEIDVRNAVAMF